MLGWLEAEARRLLNTVIWSWRGWCAAWATQKSLRQWSAVNLVSAALAFALPLEPVERALILALGVLILAAELFNTAIETAINYISVARHPKAAMAKDCGSAGVALAAIAAALAWACILWRIYIG